MRTSTHDEVGCVLVHMGVRVTVCVLLRMGKECGGLRRKRKARYYEQEGGMMVFARWCDNESAARCTV